MINFVFALETDIGKALQDLPASSAGFWSKGLNALLNNLATVFVVAAVAIALFLFLIGGIKWISSRGDKEALGAAQKTITTALIGLIIVFAAWAILTLIKNFFGLPVSKGDGSRTPAAGNCLATCTAVGCPPPTSICGNPYCSFCYQNCRCQCDSKMKPWYLDNPWDDADGNRYACQGGVRVKSK